MKLPKFNFKSIFNWVVEKDLFEKSIVDAAGKPSSTRIQGYLMFILVSILIITLLVLIVISAVKTIYSGGTYTPSTQDLVFLSLILGHHLTLLRIKKGADAYSVQALEKKIEKEKGSTNDKENGIK